VSTLRIDRLTLRVTGMPPERAQRLAERLAANLARVGLDGGASGFIHELRVNVPQGAMNATDELAAQIAAEIARAVERTS
jgi:hypothetical protein